jgi:hypothetical protein
MTAPFTSAASPSEIPQGLKIASTLSWLMGVITLAIGLAIGIPAASTAGRGLLPAVGMAAAGLALCYAGYGLRKALPSGAIAAIAASGAYIVFQLVTTGGKIALAMWFHLAIIGLVASNWKHLRRGSSRVGT